MAALSDLVRWGGSAGSALEKAAAVVATCSSVAFMLSPAAAARVKVLRALERARENCRGRDRERPHTLV
eukprot:scaffold144783_cov15-Tisochrysis_lutea.AAC.1